MAERANARPVLTKSCTRSRKLKMAMSHITTKPAPRAKAKAVAKAPAKIAKADPTPLTYDERRQQKLVELRQLVRAPGARVKMVAAVTKHFEAWTAFEDYVHSTPDDAQELPEYDKMMRAEDRALAALCRTTPKIMADVAYRAAYLSRWLEGQDLWARRRAADDLLKSHIVPIKASITTDDIDTDAGLLALKVAFDEALTVQRALDKQHEAGEPVGKELDAAYVKVSRIAGRIAATPAHTVSGLAVKNAAFEWCRSDSDPDDPRYKLGDTTDLKIVGGIMRDIRRMVRPPAYSSDHPWLLARRLSTELSAALARADNGTTMAIIKPASARDAIMWGDMDVFGSMLPLKPVEIEDKGDQLQGDIEALHELVRTISWDLANLCHDHPEKPGERHTELDQVGRLVRVLETVADKLVADVDEHVAHLYGVAGANRTNFDDVQKARRDVPSAIVARDSEGGFKQIGELAREMLAKIEPAPAVSH
jgi:hypothetical protein